LKPMTNMTQMFKAMTIRAQNLKIISLVIVPVSVFMMNSKNMRVLFIPAAFADIYLARFFHVCTNCCKRWSTIFNLLFIAALNRAIFFARSLSGLILNSTCIASPLLFIRSSSVNVIAILRTEFSNAYARIKDIEFFRANNTGNYFSSCVG